MKISQAHSNRRAHNWLIYDVGDQFLQKYSDLYKGSLYDLGAGESPFKDFFLKYADRYVAVDWAGSYHNTKADIAADLNKLLPIENEVADSVVSLSVMEHLCEPQTMLNEAYRILKPGGAIVLQVPFMWQVHEAPYDYFRYTCYGLEYMFKKAGFEDILVEASTGFWGMWILKINYMTARVVASIKFASLRFLVRCCLIPFWWGGQVTAKFLDRLHQSKGETAGYFVVARKS